MVVVCPGVDAAGGKIAADDVVVETGRELTAASTILSIASAKPIAASCSTASSSTAGKDSSAAKTISEMVPNS
jgi:hypothetical protein